MSGGRIELGIGTGWFEEEHRAYGIPFPGSAERFDRLDEQLQIITGLWDTPAGGRFSFAGQYYKLIDSPALPKPVQVPHPPIVIGGLGKERTPSLAARHASEFNVAFADSATTASQFDRVRAACGAVGRDPATIWMSAALTLCCGRSDAEVKRRASAIGFDADSVRTDGLTGSPAEVLDKLGRFAEIGAHRIYLQVLDLSDLNHLELVAAEVLPAAQRL